MRNDPSRPENTVSFKLGRWVEARATGWGVAALLALCALFAVVVMLGGVLPK